MNTEDRCIVCGQPVAKDAFGLKVSIYRHEIRRQLENQGYAEPSCPCCGGPKSRGKEDGDSMKPPEGA